MGAGGDCWILLSKTSDTQGLLSFVAYATAHNVDGHYVEGFPLPSSGTGQGTRLGRYVGPLAAIVATPERP